MPPNPKFRKEEVIAAAMELVRERGEEALTARELGARLGASPRPIFTLFSSMEEVRAGALEKGYAFYKALCEQEMASGKYLPYKATGMAYIRMAAEEKNLFRFMFMRDRSKEEAAGHDQVVLGMVQAQVGLSAAEADLFHTKMWIFVHGIATMLATSFMDWDQERVSLMISDVYEGLKGKLDHE